MANSKPGTYDESSIRVLKGLEPVRLRPGQFTRTDTPLHIVQEAIDNAVDEAIGGHAKLLAVTLHADGSASVVDDGRGIPVGPHPIEKTPVVEAIFTILYSGGKFDKTSGAAAYTYAGGLHGVGVSVTNALSTRLECEVKREGKLHRIVFAGGDVAEKLTVKGKATGTGTAVRIWPDPKYFETPVVPPDELAQLLRTKAVLLPGLRVTLTVETTAGGETREWQYREGLAGFLAELAQDEPPLVPVFAGKNHATESDETFAEGEGVEWAFSWYENARGDGAAFVNLIPTPLGGTHVSGLRSAVFGAVTAFIDHHSLLPKGLKLTPDDVCRNLRYVASVRMLDPQFAAQTKDKLTSREGVRLVERMIRDPLEIWLNQHVADAKAIADLAIRQALARTRAAKTVERKRSSSVVMLPGKLADCESSDPAASELFLVEGDSAGGSAKMARNKENQAILPLRGKGMNVWEKDAQQALENEEIRDLTTALGVLAARSRGHPRLDPAALRHRGDHVRRRRRRPAHPDAAAHALLPPLPAVDRPRPRLRRLPAAVPDRRRQRWQEAQRRRSSTRWTAPSSSRGRTGCARKATRSWKVGRFKGLGEMDPSSCGRRRSIPTRGGCCA